MSFKNNKKWGLFFTLCLTAIIVWLISVHFIFVFKPERIIFQRGSTLYTMNRDGSNQQPVLFVSSTMNWWMMDAISNPVSSPDGSKIAFACTNYKDKTDINICTIAKKDIPELTTIPIKGYPEFLTNKKIQMIPLPDICSINAPDWNQDNLLFVHFLNSLSWSPDGEKLATSCQNTFCIISVKDNSADCSSSSKNLARYSEWSPLYLEEFLTQDEGQICIYSVDNGIQKCLTDGWSPTWSPNGQQIALFSRVSSQKSAFFHAPVGIKIINRDGSNEHWVYRTEYSKETLTMPGYALTLESLGPSRPQRLSWSPNGDYLVFSARVYPATDYMADQLPEALIRLNIKTGEAFLLTPFPIPGEFDYFLDASWIQ